MTPGPESWKGTKEVPTLPSSQRPAGPQSSPVLTGPQAIPSPHTPETTRSVEQLAASLDLELPPSSGEAVVPPLPDRVPRLLPKLPDSPLLDRSELPPLP